MIDWPENLIEEIAYRRVIVFIGSGVSATAKNADNQSPKIWAEFIESAKSIMRNSDGQRDFVDTMLAENNYLLALQAIKADSDPGRYSAFLRQEFSRNNFQPSDTHRAIKEIDSKIVVSTNFDKIYEKLCSDDGYAICEYTNPQMIASNLKSPNNVIIKAHGNINDIQNLIFTSEQYYNALRNYPEFYKILESLFVTHTAMFLGYSLNDPDINLMLQNTINSSSETCPHYLIMKDGVDNNIKRHWEKTYNISCLEYGPTYDIFQNEIENLKNQVIEFRVERGLP